MYHPNLTTALMDSFSIILRDRLLEHLATDKEGLGETGQQERYSAHPQVPLPLCHCSTLYN